MYGLEVCKSLNLPPDFLTRAHDLRIKYNTYYKNTLSQETSRYNSNKIKDNCEICKTQIGTEIHHLEYQMDSKAGFIKTKHSNFHKNHSANLINICSICHDKIHKDQLKLTIKKTNDGYELQL
jgi:DNA mismatch repair protein MutS